MGERIIDFEGAHPRGKPSEDLRFNNTPAQLAAAAEIDGRLIVVYVPRDGVGLVKRLTNNPVEPDAEREDIAVRLCRELNRTTGADTGGVWCTGWTDFGVRDPKLYDTLVYGWMDADGFMPFTTASPREHPRMIAKHFEEFVTSAWEAFRTVQGMKDAVGMPESVLRVPDVRFH